MANGSESDALAGENAQVVPLTKRLLTGVVVGFSAIAIVLVAVWVSLDRRHRAVEENVESIVSAEGAASGHAYAMENATTAVGLAVDEYVATGADGVRAKLKPQTLAFARALKKFEDLSRTPSQRALGVQVAALHDRQLAVGGVAMELRDRREQLRARAAENFVQLDRTRGELPARGASHEVDVQLAALEGDLRDLERGLGQFFALPDDPRKVRALADLADVTARLELFRHLRLAVPEQRLVARAETVIQLLAVDVREIIDLDERIRNSSRERVEMRGELEALHHTIQGIAHLELAAATEKATAAIRPEASFALVGASIIVASLAGGTILWRSLQLRTAAAKLDVETQRRRAAERERGRLLERLLTAQEEERARVSRELHDQIGQKLSALVFGLDGLGLRATSGEAPIEERDVARLRDLAGELLDDAQSVAHQLRPPELTDLGLHRALASLIDSWQSSYGIAVDYFSELEGVGLTSVVETTLFRVVQEALTNVRKYAKAGSVSVLLKRLPESVRLVIDDDGRGFDAEQSSDPLRPYGPLGLRGIRERVELVGGTVKVESSVGVGTTLLVVIPLAH